MGNQASTSSFVQRLSSISNSGGEKEGKKGVAVGGNHGKSGKGLLNQRRVSMSRQPRTIEDLKNAGAVIPSSEIKFTKQSNRGFGRTAQVHNALWNGKEVAVKQFQYVRASPAIVAGFVAEAGVMLSCRHPNITTAYGICLEPRMSIVLEWVGCNLFDAAKRVGPFPLPAILKMALGLARALEYLHSKDIIHRDLKPHNLLLKEDYQVKLCDFGLAVQSKANLTDQQVGTSGWSAPEVMAGFDYGLASDVFSFGMNVWAMTEAARLVQPESKDWQERKFSPSFRSLAPVSLNASTSPSDNHVNNPPSNLPPSATFNFSPHHPNPAPSPLPSARSRILIQKGSFSALYPVPDANTQTDGPADATSSEYPVGIDEDDELCAAFEGLVLDPEAMKNGSGSSNGSVTAEGDAIGINNPLQGLTANVYHDVLKQGCRPCIDQVDDALAELIIACWNLSPKARPTMSQVVDWLHRIIASLPESKST